MGCGCRLMGVDGDGFCLCVGDLVYGLVCGCGGCGCGFICDGFGCGYVGKLGDCLFGDCVGGWGVLRVVVLGGGGVVFVIVYSDC